MSELKSIALEYHMLGYNVVPVNHEGYPTTDYWQEFLTSQQSAEGVEVLPWQLAKGIAVVNGSESEQMPSTHWANIPYLVLVYEALPNCDVSPIKPDEILPFLGKEAVSKSLDRQEKGDAELIRTMYQGRLVYDHAEKEWFFWNGKRWNKDTTKMMPHLISEQLFPQYRQLANELYAQDRSTESNANEGKIETARRRAKEVLNKRRLAAIEELAKSLMPLEQEWDTTPYKWAVRNGVVDLKSGRLIPGHPTHYIRTVSPVEWKGLGCPAPRFEQFLTEIFEGDQAVISFVQRVLGYSLIGQQLEHVLIIFQGIGRNGKDTLLETLAQVMGNQAGPVSIDVLIAADNRRNGGAPKPHLMALKGKRIAWVSETPENAPLGVADVKHITGGGQIPARGLYENDGTFSPTHLMILSTNFLPTIKSSDYALWERIHVVRFPISFVANPVRPHERKRDNQLREQLKAEASGIAAWLVRGCLMYQQEGLNPPDCVKAHTQAYQQDSDSVSRFLNECCDTDMKGKVPAEALQEAYSRWSVENSIPNLNKKEFSQRMVHLGYPKARNGKGNIYQGIKLKAG